MTSRSSVSLKRDRGRQRNPKLIFVATEGQLTEKRYLEFFEYNTKIVIVPIPSQNGKSSPKYILENLNLFKQNRGPADEVGKYQIIEGRDEFWLMIDTDRWIRSNNIQTFTEVVQEALQHEYRLAISNSSFEVWLYLHLSEIQPQDEGQPSEYFETKIRDIVGSYNKANPQKEVFLPLAEIAVARCKELFDKDTNRWPQRTGSHVYRLIESILQS